jgi:3-phytase
MKFRLLILLLLIAAAVLPLRAQDAAPAPLEVVTRGETVESPGDGANGVGIWVHPTDPAQSVIIGADDNEGVGVYALDGTLLQFLSDDGGINNVDLRYNFPFAGRRITLISGAVKDELRINLYTIDAETRELSVFGSIPTGIRLNSVCMYVSSLTGSYYVVAISEAGQIEQYLLEDEDGELQYSLARAISVGTEVEGCAVDDALSRIYFAEEETPVIWRYGAEPETGDLRSIVESGNARIVEQVEGLALLPMSERGAGYLLASNEQGDSFLVYERGGANAFVGEFRITGSEAGDQVSEPNGIDVVGLPLGDLYPQGLLVTSDDVNSQPNADNNYKLISWADVAAGLNLAVDTAFDPRTVGLQPIVESTAVSITALAETQPVPSGTDAADDPAIWIHPTDPALSTIIGTDKTSGLVVYDLDGAILQEVNIGRVNNVDLRYNVALGGEAVAIVAATNRTTNSLDLYRVNPETRLLELAAPPIASGVEEVYGVCLYHSLGTGKVYAFVNSADTGEVEQYELSDDGAGTLAATVVREFVVGSQTEGCVADDETGALYVGEEAVGLWRYGAEPDAGDARVQIDNTTPSGNLTADVEGVALYYGADGTGYLIASSQGSSEFVVYDRQGDNAYIGTFRILETATIDAVSGTDGLDVTNFALSAAYPDGLLIVQDDLNIDPDENQNFKLVSWRAVAEALGLTIDTSFDPRQVGAES